MKKMIAIMVCAAFLAGCTARVGDLTAVSTKTYNLNGGKLYKGKRVTSEDTYPVVLFPIGIPSVKTAIDHAIEQDKCAVALSDVVVTQLNHAFIFGKIGVRVEGNLIMDPTKSGCGMVTPQ